MVMRERRVATALSELAEWCEETATEYPFAGDEHDGSEVLAEWRRVRPWLPWMRDAMAIRDLPEYFNCFDVREVVPQEASPFTGCAWLVPGPVIVRVSTICALDMSGCPYGLAVSLPELLSPSAVLETRVARDMIGVDAVCRGRCLGGRDVRLVLDPASTGGVELVYAEVI